MVRKAIVFYNGWSLDHHVINHLDTGDYELIHVNKYQDYDMLKVEEKLKNFDELHLVGYSVGTWFANELMEATSFEFKTKLAINGCSYSIDDKYGIPSSIFEGTLDSLTPAHLVDFDKNCNDKKLIERERDFLDCFEELQFFYDNYKPRENLFTSAIISKYDLIFPARNLLRFYKGKKTKVIDAPHLPFEKFKSWEEILKQV